MADRVLRSGFGRSDADLIEFLIKHHPTWAVVVALAEDMEARAAVFVPNEDLLSGAHALRRAARELADAIAIHVETV